jgi:hypothetical protein
MARMEHGSSSMFQMEWAGTGIRLERNTDAIEPASRTATACWPSKPAPC